MTSSTTARQKGNDWFRTAGEGVAPVIRLERYQKALTNYHKALNSATNDDEKCASLKNIAVTTDYISKLLIQRNEIDQCLFHYKECLTYGNQAIACGRESKPESWVENLEDRMQNVFYGIFDLILEMKQDRRVSILQRFSCLPVSNVQRSAMLKQLIMDYFQVSVVALEENDYKASITALTEVYTPLTQLEDLVTKSIDVDIILHDFVSDLKEDIFKNRCIADSMQKRFLADQLLHRTINDAEDLDVTAIWQVIDFYTESILLTRESDVEQEAITLSKLGVLYHKVLLQKDRAKEVLMRALQLAKSLQPRNLSEEQWFKDASAIIAEYQSEQKRKEEKEWSEARKKYMIALKSKLDVLKDKFNKLSIQKILVWLYTDHPPKHGTRKFDVNVKQVGRAKADSLKKLLAKAIVFYHPDKIDVEIHGTEYKVWCEEIVKNLTAKYECMKGC